VDEKEYCELFIENMEESIEKYEACPPEFVVLEKGSKPECRRYKRNDFICPTFERIEIGL